MVQFKIPFTQKLIPLRGRRGNETTVYPILNRDGTPAMGDCALWIRLSFKLKFIRFIWELKPYEP